ncbi:DNA-binding transcriptional ArsR family regulator [Spinactinospora alkalitolerans]|uniref:DNA-binding transcriptional ArsR family regulator n=1 Tax=Spinactinospora alkalitolerans TaxID=687207 RepID=A0A852U4X0_9ACTN|nr:metalloregulator ArsR/SmtB family transcription factor [Spinactinospora alkalitolerans]NYE50585.1 DNA-binding transcriptional ArsR family regulator [Spinactinospora alkalitolerans]
MSSLPETSAEFTWLPQPDLATLDVGVLLHALADPTRLQIVRLLMEKGEGSCGSLELPVNRSTVSHHLRILRDSGVVSTRLQGTSRLSRLRWDEIEERFPGLFPAIIDAAPPADRTSGGRSH